MNAALRATLTPARRPCGSMSVRVNGEACVLRCSGALWVEAHRTLVAGDLHLEKGSAFAARGQMLPPYDSRATLDRLETEIEELSPARVVLLGDSFHDGRSLERMDPGDRARLDRLTLAHEWVWIEGNHDREGLAGLRGMVMGEMTVGALRLVHEPAGGASPGEVAGHLHPCARISAYTRSVRRPCFVTDGARIVLPAFGAFTGGLNVLDPAFEPLFTDRPMVAALGADRIHALPWNRLLDR